MKETICSKWSKVLPLIVELIKKGGKNGNGRAAYPENVPIHFNIGIKHCFSCINVCQVPREVLKTEDEGRGFQHLSRDLANVNVLENNV